MPTNSFTSLPLFDQILYILLFALLLTLLFLFISLAYKALLDWKISRNRTNSPPNFDMSSPSTDESSSFETKPLTSFQKALHKTITHLRSTPDSDSLSYAKTFSITFFKLRLRPLFSLSESDYTELQRILVKTDKDYRRIPYTEEEAAVLLQKYPLFLSKQESTSSPGEFTLLPIDPYLPYFLLPEYNFWNIFRTDTCISLVEATYERIRDTFLHQNDPTFISKLNEPLSFGEETYFTIILYASYPEEGTVYRSTSEHLYLMIPFLYEYRKHLNEKTKSLEENLK